MRNKKILIVVALVLVTFLTIPFTANAEKEDEAKEIIKKEDEDVKENIPNVPSAEEVFGDEEIKNIEVETPASVTGEKMEGQGTVVDFTTTGERAFYTIVDNDNNAFYLIIDMDKSNNNVYFLSEAGQPMSNNNEGSTEKTIIPKQDEDLKDLSEEEDKKEKPVKREEPKKSNNLGFLITILVIGLTGVLAYHFTKKKKNANTNQEDEINEEENEDLTSYDDDFIGFDEEENNNEQEDEDK